MGLPDRSFGEAIPEVARRLGAEDSAQATLQKMVELATVDDDGSGQPRRADVSPQRRPDRAGAVLRVSDAYVARPVTSRGGRRAPAA